MCLNTITFGCCVTMSQIYQIVKCWRDVWSNCQDYYNTDTFSSIPNDDIDSNPDTEVQLQGMNNPSFEVV